MLPRRPLGSSGIEVSLLGLGGNVFGPPRLTLEQSRAVVDAAADLGVDFVDTANVYSGGESERHLGEVLDGRRHRWVIATKFNVRELGDGDLRTHVREQVHASLRRLRTDYIDLLQIHHAWPDSVAHVELLEVLDGLVRDGAVRAIGACNVAAWRLAECAALSREHGLASFATVQDYWHVLARGAEIEVVPYASRSGIGVLPYHPLGGGYLTGKYEPGRTRPAGTRGAAGSPIIDTLDSPEVHAKVVALAAIAARHGRSPAELALAYLAAQPAVASVIAGASTPEQLRQNASGVSWSLDPDVLAEIAVVVGELPDLEVLPYRPSAPAPGRG